MVSRCWQVTFVNGSKLCIYTNNAKPDAKRTIHAVRRCRICPQPHLCSHSTANARSTKVVEHARKGIREGHRSRKGKRENASHNFRPSNRLGAHLLEEQGHPANEHGIIHVPVRCQMLSRETLPLTTVGMTRRYRKRRQNDASGVMQPTGRCEKIKRSGKRSLDRWQARRNRRYESG